VAWRARVDHRQLAGKRGAARLVADGYPEVRARRALGGSDAAEAGTVTRRGTLGGEAKEPYI
jgi:hypothetical protein